ncbi:MAG: TraB/GumN family protein, partial [Duncaniella sp.]|nr:TraB/GumN family protein [Duncaniella sp.]
AEELMNTVRKDSKALELSKKLVEAYLDGDLNKMLELIEDPELGAGDGSERILNRRNADWVRVIAGLIPSASILIAVGAGHLPG